jgi:hypothetical protein
MSRKRLTREQQIELDTERLNDAIDELIAQAEMVLVGVGWNSDAQRQTAQAKLRLDAIRALPALLERKAKLLGLDAVVTEAPGQAASGTLAELEKKLGLVAKLS